MSTTHGAAIWMQALENIFGALQPGPGAAHAGFGGYGPLEWGICPDICKDLCQVFESKGGLELARGLH